MHLLYHCINHFDYFIFLYADIYLISSARNKSIVLSSIKLFSSFALTPTQTGKTDDYIHEEDINIHIACISIFNSKGSSPHPHEHESLVSGLIWTFLRRDWKYLWSQALCQCLVRLVTSVCSLLIGPQAEYWPLIGWCWPNFVDLILSPHRRMAAEFRGHVLLGEQWVMRRRVIIIEDHNNLDCRHHLFYQRNISTFST